MTDSLRTNLLQLLYTLPAILIALTFHEYAHGYVAYRCGDDTALKLGRLTLNPIKHLDPIGTICMILFHFGWARPVPVNSRNFKKPRRDMILVALAGVTMNLILAFCGILLLRILLAIWEGVSDSGSFGADLLYVTCTFFMWFASLNIYLAVFNLLPIPPLDGSRILTALLPAKIAFTIHQYERYISLVLVLLLCLGLLRTPLSYVHNLVYNGMDWLVGLLPFL